MYYQTNPWLQGPGIRPEFNAGRFITGADMDALVTGNIFTVTATNCTPTLNNVGGVPCIDLTNSGSTATDGAQFQGVAASIIPQASKQVRFKFGFRMTTADQDLAFGLNAMDTSIIASDSTDFLHLRKLAAATVFSARGRKASGTAETWTLSPTIAAATWYDCEIVLTRDANTAGKGRMAVYLGASVAGGGTLPLIFDDTIATQFADTIKLSPCFAWRAGSAANVSCYISYIGWLVEA